SVNEPLRTAVLMSCEFPSTVRCLSLFFEPVNPTPRSSIFWSEFLRDTTPYQISASSDQRSSQHMIKLCHIFTFQNMEVLCVIYAPLDFTPDANIVIKCCSTKLNAAICAKKVHKSAFNGPKNRNSDLGFSVNFYSLLRFNSESLPEQVSRRPMGVAQISQITFQNKIAHDLELHVVQEDVNPVIGRPWLRALGIIDAHNNVHLQMNSISIDSDSFKEKLENLKKRYSSLFDGKIVKGIRTVIPSSLKKYILKELHLGHLGSTKMKTLARQYCYWEGIDAAIETLAKSCESCHNKLQNPAQEYHPWEPASSVWVRIHIDFAELEKRQFLIIVDAYSKWLEILPMSSTTTQSTIEVLQSLFARYGLPQTIVSDNGPQFKSPEFGVFMQQNGINHRFTAPYHPNSNGQAERYVRTFKESVKSDGSRSLSERLAKFLVSYRRAPNTATGRSPLEMFLHRQIRSRIDLLKCDLRWSPMDDGMATRSSFSDGDRVLARMFGSSYPKWMPGTVVGREGSSMYLIQLQGTTDTIRRHIDQLRNNVISAEHAVEPSNQSTTFNVDPPNRRPNQPEDEGDQNPAIRRSSRV
ncbi:unnamed protein product, partial [Nesidiocoris tenuis]